MHTSARPISPAMMPIRNWLLPRVAEICCSESIEKDTGSAPYFNCSDRNLASSSVKLPVICARPSVITAFMVGAETTEPSSTIANRLRAPFCPPWPSP